MLPLADLLNHGGDEYPASASSPANRGGKASEAPDAKKWPPAGCSDNIAWSELSDEGVIEFAATRDIEPHEEAAMSYGERSNDHFLVYYGFVPPRNPHATSWCSPASIPRCRGTWCSIPSCGTWTRLRRR